MESRKDYLRRRADEEDAAANRASSDKARKLHEERATRYRDAADSKSDRGETETIDSIRPKELRIID